MVMVMLMVMVRVMAMEMATMLFFKHIMTIRSTSTQKVTHSNAPRVQVLDTVLRYCLHVQKVAAMMVQWCVGWEPLVLDLRTIRIHQTTMLPI